MNFVERLQLIKKSVTLSHPEDLSDWELELLLKLIEKQIAEIRKELEK